MLLPAEDVAQRHRDVPRRQGSRGHLIAERLEQVVVVAVDQDDLRAGVTQRLDRLEPAEAAADHDNAVPGCRVVHRIKPTQSGSERSRLRRGVARVYLGCPPGLPVSPPQPRAASIPRPLPPSPAGTGGRWALPELWTAAGRVRQAVDRLAAEPPDTRHPHAVVVDARRCHPRLPGRGGHARPGLGAPRERPACRTSANARRCPRCWS